MKILELTGEKALKCEHAQHWNHWLNLNGRSRNRIQEEYLQAKARSQEIVTFQLTKENKFQAGCSLLLRQTENSGTTKKIFMISRVIVAPECRNQGMLRRVFFEVNSFLEDENVTGLIVARRGVDGMYEKLGFSPFATFTKYDLINKIENATKVIGVDRLIPDNLVKISFIKELYNLNFRTFFPSLSRGEIEWRYIIEQNLKNNISIYMINYKFDSVGYFILRDREIIEIAMLSNLDRQFYHEILSRIFISFNIDSLRIQSSHPLIEFHLEIWKKVESRQPIQGGHLLRLPKSASDLMREQIRKTSGTFISVLDEF